jgi:hypothetical protein
VPRSVSGANHDEAPTDPKLSMNAASWLGRGEVQLKAKCPLQENQRAILIGVPQMRDDARPKARSLIHDRAR